MEITNELGVIVRFAEMCVIPGFPWEIESISGFFPDAAIKHKKTGKVYSAEFEYKSSSFVSHDHNLLACDVIICWEHDWPECPISVWELDADIDYSIRPVPACDIERYQHQLELKKLRNRITSLERLIEQGQIVFDSIALDLTNYESRLMLLLLENEDRVCDREQIAQAIWGRQYSYNDNGRIEKLVQRLRTKLDDIPFAEIVTHRGLGYLFTRSETPQ